MSNSVDPDQARHFVGPDMSPNCMQKLSAADTRHLGLRLNNNKKEKKKLPPSYRIFVKNPDLVVIVG